MVTRRILARWLCAVLCMCALFLSPLPASAQGVPALIAQTQQGDLASRLAAMKSLGRLRLKDAVLPLLTVLKDDNPTLRAQAAETLGQIGDPIAVNPLVDALQDEFVTVRTQAAVALGRLKDAAAVDALLAVLRDPASDIHKPAIEALGRIGNGKAAAPLLDLLLNGKPELRETAGQALAGMKDPQAIAVYGQLTTHEQQQMRLIGIELLLRLGTTAAAEQLGKLLGTERDPAVRQYIISALANMPKSAADDALAAALNDADWNIRLLALQALLAHGDPRANEPALALMQYTLPPSAQQQLITNMTDPRALPYIMNILMPGKERYSYWDNNSALLRRFGEPAVDALLGKMRQPGQSNQRYQAAQLLGKLQHPKSIEPLLGMLQDKEDYVRAAAAQALLIQRDLDYRLSRELNGESEPIAFRVPPFRRGAWCRDPRLVDYLLNAFRQKQEVQFSLLRGLDDPRLIEPMLAYLNDEKRESWELQQALEAIMTIDNAEAQEKVLAILQNPEWKELRQDAIRALGGMYSAPVEPLLPLLKDPDVDFRKQVIKALAMRGDARAVPALIELRQADADGGVREYAALALGMIGDARAYDALVAGMQDQTEWARSAAAWGVGKLGDTRGLEALKKAIRPGDTRFNVRIGRALVQLGDDSGIDLLLESMAVEDEMTRAIAAVSLRDIKGPRILDTLLPGLSDTAGWVSGESLSTLRNLRDPRCVEGLLPLLDHEKADARAAAAEALGYMGQSELREKIITALVRQLANPDGEQPQVAAAMALVRLGDAHGLPLVLAHAGRIDSEQRVPALLALAETPAAATRQAEFHAAVPSLATVLTDTDPLNGVLAARALAHFGDARGTEFLRAILARDEELVVNLFTVRYLGEAKDRQAVAVLLERLPKARLALQKEIITALGAIGDPAAAPRLIALLQGADPRLREVAAQALGGIDAPQVGPALTAALTDEVSKVREAAARALERLNDYDARPALTKLLKTESRQQSARRRRGGAEKVKG